MSDKAKPEKGDVTIQPSVSTEEAAQTDEVLSPVGDEKVPVPPRDPDDLDDISENG